MLELVDSPPKIAAVLELVDRQDLKSCDGLAHRESSILSRGTYRTYHEPEHSSVHGTLNRSLIWFGVKSCGGHPTVGVQLPPLAQDY